MSDHELLIAIYNNVMEMKADIKELQEKMKKANTNIEELQVVTESIKKEVITLEEKVNNIGVTLETETNRGIRIVAEGHTDLNRKLHEAQKSDQDRELIMVVVNHLESQIRMLKNQLAKIA